MSKPCCHVLPLLLLLWSALGWPATLNAQPCLDDKRALFDGARRARRALDERHAAQAKLDEVLDQVALTRERAQDQDPLLIALSMGGEVGFWGAPHLCQGGDRQDASLLARRGDMMVAVVERDWRLRVDGFLLRATDVLTEQPTSEQGSDELAPLRTQRTQALLGLRLQLGQWLSLFAAEISESSWADPLSAPELRRHLALGVPALGLSVELIASPEDRAPQTIYLDLHRLQLTDSGWAVSGRVGYLEDEGQVFTLLGVIIPLLGAPTANINLVEGSSAQPDAWTPAQIQRGFLWLSAESSVEWSGVALRHARLRLGWDMHEATPLDEEGYVGTGHLRLWADVTRFSSAALFAQTQRRDAWGGSAGLTAAGATRATRGGVSFAASADLMLALHRPELLAMASTLVFAGVEARLGGSIAIYF